jgi:hypothetical protein
MGFTPTEMISLVACGHTIGGVKKAVNPTLTNDTYHHFDETHAAFDNRVAIEYINDTRQNPLAQPYDADYPERSSDTRIFEVDNNATLSKYAASQDAMMADCKTVFSKMLNEAVPSSVTLQGPITPFPVSGTWWPNTRNGNSILPSSTSSVRLYDMVGQWTSFEMGYTYRDGTEATDDWIVLAAVRTISNGKPIEVRDFNSASVPINPAKGLGSLLIKVTLNDGTMYTSEEGEEVMPFDDTILVDIGNLYTCKYSDTANNNAAGMNMTVHVLGPYDAADNVEMIFRNDEMELQYITANYMGARDDYYNLYNIFIPDVTALGFTGFGARVTRADGSVHKDTKDDDYYRYSSLSKCVAGVDVPAPIPVPSAAARRRAARKRLAPACPSGRSLCGGQCVDILRNIEHCGGCAGAGGVDCTAISDGSIACIAGQCVRS